MDHAAQELITRHNEQTRELIVRDIDALERKLNVKRQVSERADAALDKVKGTLGMKHTHSDGIGGFLRENAAPLLAVGVGGALLARNARQQVSESSAGSGHTSESTYVPFRTEGDVGGTTDPTIRDRAGSIASDVQSKASDGLEATKDKVSGAADSVAGTAVHAKDIVVERIPSRQDASRMARDHNQLVGLAALAAGAVAGTFVPRSRMEKERIAPVQAQVKEKAGEIVETGVEKAQETAERAADALSVAKDAAKEEFADAGESQPPGGGDASGSMSDVTMPNRITGSTRTEVATGVNTPGTRGSSGSSGG